MRASATEAFCCDAVAAAREVGVQPADLPLARRLSDLSPYPRWLAFVTLTLDPVWGHRGRCVQIQQREYCHAWRRPLLADACMGAMYGSGWGSRRQLERHPAAEKLTCTTRAPSASKSKKLITPTVSGRRSTGLDSRVWACSRIAGSSTRPS